MIRTLSILIALLAFALAWPVWARGNNPLREETETPRSETMRNGWMSAQADTQERIAEPDGPPVALKIRILETDRVFFLRNIGKQIRDEGMETEEAQENVCPAWNSAQLAALRPMLFSREQTRLLDIALSEQEKNGTARQSGSIGRILTYNNRKAIMQSGYARRKIEITPQISGENHLRLTIGIADWPGIRNRSGDRISEDAEVRIETGGAVMVDACFEPEPSPPYIVLIIPFIVDTSEDQIRLK